MHEVVIYLHVVQTLRMSGTVPLLPLYAFMVWIGLALSLCGGKNCHPKQV
jgi:hypothetical protein